MRFAQPEKGPEIQMNMMPMIDCVFQLILFFMIMTDLSKKELEELYLPKCEIGVPDKPGAQELRPVDNVLADGRMYVRGVACHDPARDADWAPLREELARLAQAMPQEPVDEARPDGPKVPRGAVLIRADQSTPAK